MVKTSAYFEPTAEVAQKAAAAIGGPEPTFGIKRRLPGKT